MQLQSISLNRTFEFVTFEKEENGKVNQRSTPEGAEVKGLKSKVFIHPLSPFRSLFNISLAD